jgi:hypothetical protein
VIIPAIRQAGANSSRIEQSIDEAFPSVPGAPGVRPSGDRVIVQLRLPKAKTQGGIILPDDTKDAAADSCQIAKIVAIGPIAYRHRELKAGQELQADGLPPYWPEGAWVKEGEFARVPKYINDYWFLTAEDGRPVKFGTIRDMDVIGPVDDPLMIASYIV